MTLSTYSELQASIADWLNREDLAAVLPTFIRLCETELAGKLDHWRMDVIAPITLDAQYVDLPADFERIRRIDLVDGTRGPLTLLTSDAMADMRDCSGHATGQPQFYCLTAGQLEVFPTPSEAFSANLVYRAALPALSDGAPVNWLLTYKPAAYLYGALVQAAPYLKDDPRIAVWAGLYQEAVAGLETENEAARFGGPLRIRQL